MTTGDPGPAGPVGEGSSRTIGIAIPVPDPYGAELQLRRREFGDPLAEAIPTHITLLPPTVVAEVAMSSVEAHLRTAAERLTAFEVRLRGTGTFRPTSPVVFVRVEGGRGDCARLEAEVRRGPLDRSLSFDYHPHVTVAHELPEENLDRAMKELTGYAADFRVTSFSLYEHGADAVWRPRRQFPLGSVRTSV